MFSQFNASSIDQSIYIFQFAKTLGEFVPYHFEHSNQCMYLLSESSRSNLLFCEIISKPRIPRICMEGSLEFDNVFVSTPGGSNKKIQLMLLRSTMYVLRKH